MINQVFKGPKDCIKRGVYREISCFNTKLRIFGGLLTTRVKRNCLIRILINGELPVKLKQLIYSR